MSAAGSLIAPEPGDHPQGLLFDELPGDVRAAVLFREDRGEYTAERFFSQQPRLYASCVRLLGMEMPVQAIARALGVSDNTVRAVRSREPESVADFAAKQGVRRRALMTRCLERMEETVGTADFKDVGVVFGIVSDKELLASGSPTAIIGTVPMPATDAFMAWAQSNGVTLDVPMDLRAAPTGFGDGAREQRGDGLADGGEGPAGDGAKTTDAE